MMGAESWICQVELEVGCQKLPFEVGAALLVVAVVVGGEKLGVEVDELSGSPVRVCVLKVVALFEGGNETGSIVLEGKGTGIGGL